MIRFEIEQIPSTRLEDLLEDTPCGFVPVTCISPTIDDEDVCMLVGEDHHDTSKCEFICIDDGCRGTLPRSTMVVPLEIVIKAKPSQ